MGQTFLFFTTLYVILPSLMIYLTLVIPRRINRVVNIALAAMYAVTIIGSAVGSGTTSSWAARSRLCCSVPSCTTPGPGRRLDPAVGDAWRVKSDTAPYAREAGVVRWGTRLVGVDAARGVALLGVMAIHVLPATGADGTVLVSERVAAGHSAAAFALLAGVGLALWSRAHPRPEERSIALAIRALAIGVIGSLLFLVDTGVDVILPAYAMLFALAIPLLWLSGRTLLTLAVILAVAVPPLSHLIRAGLSEQAAQARPVDLLLTGAYPVLGWLTYMCAGLAAGRLDLRSSRVAAALLAGGAALAVGTKAVSWFLLDVAGGREHLAASAGLAPGSPELTRLLLTSQHGVTPTDTWWWLAVSTPHSTTTLDLLHTAATSLALLGAALLLARWSRWILLPFAAAGSMTLTLYTAHVLLVNSPLMPADPTWSYAAQATAAVLVALLWRLRFRRGPLEQLVAALSVRGSSKALRFLRA